MLHLCRCPRMRGKSQVPPSKNSFNNNFQIFNSSCPVSLEDTTVIFSNAPEFSLALSLPFSLLRFTNTLMSSGLCQCVSTALNLLSSVDPNGNFVNGNFVNFSQSVFFFSSLSRSLNSFDEPSRTTFRVRSAESSARNSIYTGVLALARLFLRSCVLLPSQGRDFGSLPGFKVRELCSSRLLGFAAGGTKHFGTSI